MYLYLSCHLISLLWHCFCIWGVVAFYVFVLAFCSIFFFICTTCFGFLYVASHLIGLLAVWLSFDQSTNWNHSATIWWITITFGTDFHDSPKMKSTDLVTSFSSAFLFVFQWHVSQILDASLWSLVQMSTVNSGMMTMVNKPYQRHHKAANVAVE